MENLKYPQQSISIAAEWTELGRLYYRKQEVYTMCWQNVDLSRYIVACGRFGGPIALVRDDSKVLLLGNEPVSPKVQIFNGSGVQVAWFHWDKGHIVQMGWTDDQNLVIVCDDAKVYQYNIHGEPLPAQLFFGLECMDQGIISAIVWGDGVVCLTEANQLFAANKMSSPQLLNLENPGQLEAPHCMAVIEPKNSKSGLLEVLLAVGTTIVVVTEQAATDKGLSIGPVTCMSVSPNGMFVALYTHDGRVVVVHSDFSGTLVDFPAEASLTVSQLVWCGVDCVLLHWDDTVLVVGPFGDSATYTYEEPVVLIQENDCARILTNSTMEIIQRVPESTTSIFKIGSTEPAAILYEALAHFDQRRVKADGNIRHIGSALPEAVETCIDAGSHEFDPLQQKALMRAAAYGRAFCEGFDAERLRSACKALRVLNGVRHFSVGMPLTYAQYKILTPSVLVARLVNSRHHLLALRISQYLELNQDIVLLHWAKSKIDTTTQIPEDQVLGLLVDKLKVSPGISFAPIAAHAHSSGRRQLAAKLLDHEPRAAEQVPLLASMGEDVHALDKAIESGDSDLVYFALFHLWRQRTPQELFQIVQAKPQARDLFVIYARENDPELLKKFYMSTSFLQGAADMVMRESWKATTDPALSSLSSSSIGRGSALQTTRIRLLEQAQDLFSRARDHAFHAKAAEEQARLLKVQQELEISEGQAIFVDSSVSDTIRTLITLGNHRAAQKIRNEFKVPEKRFYWLKICALATAHDWDALDKFSKEKRPPLGFKPFAEACIEEGATAEAAKYIAKLTDASEKAEFYSRIGMREEAEAAAAQAKDDDILGRIKSTFGQNNASFAFIDTWRDRLTMQG